MLPRRSALAAAVVAPAIVAADEEQQHSQAMRDRARPPARSLAFGANAPIASRMLSGLPQCRAECFAISMTSEPDVFCVLHPVCVFPPSFAGKQLSDLDVLVVARGPLSAFSVQDLRTNVSDTHYVLQNKRLVASRAGDRCRARAPSWPRPGLGRAADFVTRAQRALPAPPLDRRWATASARGVPPIRGFTGGQASHRDKGGHVRVVHGITEDGLPRVGVRLFCPDGVVRATYIHADGRRQEIASDVGQPLDLERCHRAAFGPPPAWALVHLTSSHGSTSRCPAVPTRSSGWSTSASSARCRWRRWSTPPSWRSETPSRSRKPIKLPNIDKLVDFEARRSATRTTWRRVTSASTACLCG